MAIEIDEYMMRITVSESHFEDEKEYVASAKISIPEFVEMAKFIINNFPEY